MSKAAELAALIGSQSALSNRNMIINGAMTVNQRGNVTGATGSTYGGPDRFYSIISSLGTWSISQDTDVPSGSGFSSSYKLACTTADASPAAGDHLMLQYRMEGQDLQQLKKGTSSAESVTLSFWVKCYKTGNFQVSLYDQDNTRIIGTTVTISIAATWEYKTLTFAGDTSGALGNDNGNSLFIEMVFDSGTDFSSGAVPTAWEAATNADRGAGTTLALGGSTNNYFNITGIQMEIGEQATPFEHRSFGDELARCQRYFQYFPSAAFGRWSNSVSCEIGNAFPVRMREVPTASINPNDNTAAIFRVGIHTNECTISGVSSVYMADTGGIVPVTVSSTASTPSAGDIAAYDTNGDSNVIFCDAEL